MLFARDNWLEPDGAIYPSHAQASRVGAIACHHALAPGMQILCSASHVVASWG